MNNPRDCKYTKDHEWVRVEGDTAVMGIADYAQSQLGDMVFVGDLPDVGSTIQQGDSAGALESVKAAADFYAPLSGEVVERNDVLLDDPGVLNREPYGAGWVLTIRPSNTAELDSLMSAEEYDEYEKAQG
ncbi:MAG TPA: glycine cleavage system protein GcvH [Chloroflexia bacterium]|nr:glycine cleavage system protein GcvH [Chloroflexia bacterium]